MPYIAKIDRERAANDPMSAGELNYAVTMLAQRFIANMGGLTYGNVNQAVGALECAKLELYRRIAAPYEDAKCAANGDVFHSLLVTGGDKPVLRFPDHPPRLKSARFCNGGPPRMTIKRGGPPSFWWALLRYWALFAPFWIGVALGIVGTLVVQHLPPPH